jgi:hypothetical protein
VDDGYPIRIIKRNSKTKNENNNHDDRTYESVPDGVRGRDEPDVHLLEEIFFLAVEYNRKWAVV